jgi:hypothetical protein
MTKQIYFSKNLAIGTKIKNKDDNRLYEVVMCIALEWLSKGENKGYLVTVKAL